MYHVLYSWRRKGLALLAHKAEATTEADVAFVDPVEVR